MGETIRDELIMKKIATQFYTPNSIVRELRYRTFTRPEVLDFDHLFLDISDTVINPYTAINREVTCNYTMLASDFISRIGFSESKTRGIILLWF